MFITIDEIIAIVVMTFAIGYIFSTFIKRAPTEGYDPRTYYDKNPFWEDLKFGAMVAAPAVVAALAVVVVEPLCLASIE